MPQLKPTLLWVLESWSLISCCCHVHNGVKIYYKLASQFSYKTTISTINLLPKYLSQTRNLWQISWKCTCREILVWIQVGFDPIVVSSFQNRACHRIDNSPLFLFSMLFNELTHWNSYRLNSAINERGEERGIFDGYKPSSIYSWFLKPLSVLHSRFLTKKSCGSLFFQLFSTFSKKIKNKLLKPFYVTFQCGC